MIVVALILILAIIPWLIALILLIQKKKAVKFLKPFLITFAIVSVTVTVTIVLANQAPGYEGLGIFLLGMLSSLVITLIGGIITLVMAFRYKSIASTETYDDILDNNI